MFILIIAAIVFIIIFKHIFFDTPQHHNRSSNYHRQYRPKKHEVKSFSESVYMGTGLYNRMLQEYYDNPYMQINGSKDPKEFKRFGDF